jgi:RNA polymerase sigma-70 factor (ECF subfamily)
MSDGEMTLGRALVEMKPADGRAQLSEDALLVAAVSAGDEQAFTELHRKFAPLVHGVLLARMPPDEVADVVQEVFLAAYRGIGSLRDADALGPWLVKLARNHAAGFYRSRRVAEELPDDIPQRRSQSTEAMEVIMAIRSLPHAYSETLMLRLVEGMTGDEITRLTGLSPGSVRVNLHRGMAMLRKMLGIEVRK